MQNSYEEVLRLPGTKYDGDIILIHKWITNWLSQELK